VEANGRSVAVVRAGLRKDIVAKDLMPGDVIYVSKGEKLSVDAAVLCSSYDDGACFVDTAELDGYGIFLFIYFILYLIYLNVYSETNLKQRSSLSDLNKFNTPEVRRSSSSSTDVVYTD
jgi:hypothetical protein